MPDPRRCPIILGLAVLANSSNAFMLPLQSSNQLLRVIPGSTVVRHVIDRTNSGVGAGQPMPEKPRPPKTRRGSPLYWKIRAAGDQRNRSLIKRMLAEHSRDAPTFRALRPDERDALIIAAARGGMAREAATLTRWTDANKNPPSVYAYGALMDLYKRRSDVASCRSILDSMTARQVAPNEVILNTFLAALAASPGGTSEEALELCQTMKQRFGVRPSSISYHPLLAAAASSMTRDQLFVDALGDGGMQSRRTAGSSGIDQGVDAVAVLNAMNMVGVQATPRTLSTLLVSLVRSRRALDAAHFLEALVTSSKSFGEERSVFFDEEDEDDEYLFSKFADAVAPVHPTLLPLLTHASVLGGSLTYSFNVVIGALVGAGHLERALGLLDLSDSVQSPSDTVALNAILKGLATSGRLDEALRIFETRLLESRAPPPDAASFNILIDALRKLAQDCTDRASYVAPFSPTSSSWSTSLKSPDRAAASSVKPQALPLVPPAPLFPPPRPPSRATSNTTSSIFSLLSSLQSCGDGKVEKQAATAVAGALALYRRMRLVERLSPDTFTYTALARLSTFSRAKDLSSSNASFVASITSRSSPLPLESLHPSIVSPTRLWLRAQRDLVGSHTLPPPLLAAFIVALGSSSSTPDLVAEVFHQLTMLEKPKTADGNALISSLARAQTIETAPEDEDVAAVAELCAALRSLLVSSPTPGSDAEVSDNDSGEVEAWDGRAETLVGALVPSPFGAAKRLAEVEEAMANGRRSSSSLVKEDNAAVHVFAGIADLFRGATALSKNDQRTDQGTPDEGNAMPSVGLAPALSGFQAAIQAFLCMRKGSLCQAPDMLWPPVDASSYAAVLQALRDTMAHDPLRGSPLAAIVADATQLLVADASAHLGPKAVASSPQLLRLAMQCCGSDTRAVYNLWKQKVKPLLRQAPPGPCRPMVVTGAYHGLIYGLGLAARPDLALQVVYAMKGAGVGTSDDGAPPLSAALEVYRGALKQRQAALDALSPQERQRREAKHPTGLLLPLTAAYEAQLDLECRPFSAPAPVEEVLYEDEPARVQGWRANLPVTKIRIRF